MKVKLTMSMVVNTENLPEGHFNKLCETYKSTHERLSTSCEHERAYWSMEEFPEIEKRIDLR